MKRIDYYKNNLKGEDTLHFPIEEPSLFAEYFTVALSRVLEREKVYKGSLFNEKEANDAFLANEIKFANDSIIDINILLKNIVQGKFKSPENIELKEEMQLDITNYGLYLNYLNTLKHIVIKPVFNTDAIETILGDLNPYFDVSTHTKLRQLIETGATSEKLLFLDNANKLCDYFKRAFESNILKGCNKKELNSWIVNSFQYKNGGVEQNFKPRTVENVLSSRESLCKNPII